MTGDQLKQLVAVLDKITAELRAMNALRVMEMKGQYDPNKARSEASREQA